MVLLLKPSCADTWVVAVGTALQLFTNCTCKGRKHVNRSQQQLRCVVGVAPAGAPLKYAQHMCIWHPALKSCIVLLSQADTAHPAEPASAHHECAFVCAATTAGTIAA
jgi:hypothetical protein